MKKVLVLMLALVLCLSVFAGCGGNNAPAANDGGNDAPAAPTGETFDAGNVSAFVPTGWKAFPVNDIWSDEENAKDPDCIQIIKGGESEFDMFTKPYLQIDFYGADTELMTPDSTWYDDVVELEAFTAGSLTWNGFTATSFDLPVAIFWAVDGDNEYQVSVWYETEEGKIGLTDADFLAILEGVKPSA